MNHTPGPWTKLVYPSGSGRSPVVITDMPDGNGLFIAEVPNPADATLIAAAPEMLEILQQVGIFATPNVWDRVNAVIAKATAAPVAKDNDK